MKRMKKALTIMMIIAMLASVVLLGGCGNTTGGTGEDTASTASAQAEKTTGEAALEDQATPAVVTIYGDAGSRPSGEIQTDPVAEEIKRITGISMKTTSALESPNYLTELNTWIASGDFPADIIYVPFEQASILMPKIVSAKAALPMDDLFEKYGKNILKDVPDRVEFSRNAWSVDMDGKNDGKVYFLGAMGDRIYDPSNPGCSVYLRWDLYKQLGYPKVETMEDYIPILQEMMKLEPVNKEGKKTYGFAGFFAEAGWGHWTVYNPFSFPYGLWYTNYLQVYDVVNDDFVNYVTGPDSAYWKGVSFWNKAERAGVVDPETYTMVFADWSEKRKMNRMFMGFANWNVAVGDSKFAADGTPEKGYVLMPQLPGTTMAYDTHAGGLRPYFIAKNSKVPEAAMRLLDYFFSFDGSMLALSGVKGTQWDVVDGKPQLKPGIVTQKKSDTEFSYNSGINKYVGLIGRGGNVIHPEYNSRVNLFFESDYIFKNLIPVRKEACDYYGIKIPTEKFIFKEASKAYFDMNTLPPIAQDKLEEINLTMNNVNSYVEQNVVKAIKAKTDDEFQQVKDKMIEELKKMGADNITQIYKDRLQQAKNLK